MGISLFVIDLDVGWLPNAIVYSSYLVLGFLLGIAALAQQDSAALLRAAVGAAGLFVVYLAVAWAYPTGMGFGDVKLAGIIGGVLGFVSYRCWLWVRSRRSRWVRRRSRENRHARRDGGRSMAFGSLMIAGALLSIFVGSAVAEIYSGLLTVAVDLERAPELGG